MAEQLALLPALSERLLYALVPGGGTCLGDRVTMGKLEAPLPARMSALTLLGPGTDDTRCVFVPAVRVWATVEQVPVAGAADGAMSTQSVPLWHRELYYDDSGHMVLIPADDQAGILPIHAWLRSWATEWRTRLAGQRPINPLDVDAGCYEPNPTATRDDPVAIEWRERFGLDEWTPATRRHHSYLVTWLGHACVAHPHIAEFSGSLRTLVGTIRAALGDVEDLEYLGRCPEEIPKHNGGGPDSSAAVCGAALWHDPYASVITCPRCHTETDPAGRIWLARRILDTFPIDRRRRYTRELIDALRPVLCATCHIPVSVEWIEATERADRERFWRPGSIACPNGCEVVQSMAESRALRESSR